MRGDVHVPFGADTGPRPDPYTYLRCQEGVVYVAFVIDAYSRAIVAWQFAAHTRSDLVSTRSHVRRTTETWKGTLIADEKSNPDL